MPGRLDKDHELIKRAQKGDHQAFGDLYEMYAPAIYRYLYAHLNDKLDAEDLTCDVFLKAWQSLPGYTDRGVPFLAYLFRVARNALVDHYRRGNRLEQKNLDDMDGYQADGVTEPAELVSNQMEHQQVLQVLSKLRTDYRMVLTLRFISGLSPDETAQVMQRSPGAIRVLQHRALAALRMVLDQAG